MEILVTGSQMKQCDKNNIETFGMPSLVLMERAALGVAEEIEGYFAGQGRERERSALIACGHGNNGGDGLAIGRILWQRGYKTTILMPQGNGKLSEETKVQKEILSKYGIAITDAMPSQEFGVIVDALFGIGLTRELQGVYREYIEGMNRKTGLKVAVDIPSGIHADTGAVMGIGFRADVTVAFAYAKLGLLLYPGAEYAGRVLVKEIGISRHSFLGEQPSVFALGTEDIGLIPARAPYSNKGTFGKVLTIAGQKNMAGAAFLSGMASYVTGAGMVRVFTEEANREILQALLPEAILTTYGGAGNQPGQEENLEKQLEEALSWATVAAAGPGLGTGKRARRLIKHLLKKAEIPVVLDADGLNLAAESPEWLKEAKAPVIVTPHLGEMARLTGSSIPKIQQGLLQEARAFAAEYHVVCVLKDARTVTALPDGRAYVNTSGNHGMATAGSGDVLSGVLAGLIAQGMEPGQAAPVGVYLHGAAADRQAAEAGAYGMAARDILGGIRSVLHSKENREAKEGRKGRK